MGKIQEIKPIGYVIDDLESLNNNFELLENNFKGEVPPEEPKEGMLWFNTEDSKLKLYKGGAWVNVTNETGHSVDWDDIVDAPALVQKIILAYDDEEGFNTIIPSLQDGELLFPLAGNVQDTAGGLMKKEQSIKIDNIADPSTGTNGQMAVIQNGKIIYQEAPSGEIPTLNQVIDADGSGGALVTDGRVLKFDKVPNSNITEGETMIQGTSMYHRAILNDGNLWQIDVSPVAMNGFHKPATGDNLNFHVGFYGINGDEPFINGTKDNLGIKYNGDGTKFLGDDNVYHELSTDSLPDQTGQAGKVLYTDGTSPFWDLPDVGMHYIGEIFAYAGTTEPIGAFECDGRSLLVADYPDLFAKIGYTYGGSGANFNLPDTYTAGRFLRSRSGSVDIGTVQEDAIRNIEGKYSVFTYQTGDGTGALYNNRTFTANTIQNGGTAGYNHNQLGFDASKVVPTANENRPVNLSVMYCIQAFHGYTSPVMREIDFQIDGDGNKFLADDGTYKELGNVKFSQDIPSTGDQRFLSVKFTPSKINQESTHYKFRVQLKGFFPYPFGEGANYPLAEDFTIDFATRGRGSDVEVLYFNNSMEWLLPDNLDVNGTNWNPREMQTPIYIRKSTTTDDYYLIFSLGNFNNIPSERSNVQVIVSSYPETAKLAEENFLSTENIIITSDWPENTTHIDLLPYKFMNNSAGDANMGVVFAQIVEPLWGSATIATTGVKVSSLEEAMQYSVKASFVGTWDGTNYAKIPVEKVFMESFSSPLGTYSPLSAEVQYWPNMLDQLRVYVYGMEGSSAQAVTYSGGQWRNFGDFYGGYLLIELIKTDYPITMPE